MNKPATPKPRDTRNTPATPEANLVGMDAHSKKIVLCLTHWQHGSDPVVLKTLSTTLDDLENTYKNNIPPEAITVLEATTNAFNITRKLHAAGHPNAFVLAADTLAGLARRDRVNDKIDAHNLALAYARGGTREVLVPSEKHQRLRDLFYGYTTAVESATRASNHIWAFCGSHGFDVPPPQRREKAPAIKAQLDAHAWDDDARFHIERLLAGYAHAAETRDLYRQRVELAVLSTPEMLRVMQVLGIGVLCAFALATFIADVTRFETAKKLAAYFGFNPVVSKSGESEGPRRLSRFGQRRIKSMVIEAAQSALRYGQGPMHAWARRKIAAGKPRNVMLCALARKMLVCVWHILMGHPVPESEAPLSYRRKLAKVAVAVRKHHPEALKEETAAAFVERVCAAVFSPSAAESGSASRPKNRVQSGG
jgi:transposase